MGISLTDEEREAILSGVRADLVAKLYEEHRSSLQLLSPAQAAGLLDVVPRTLATLPDLPRVEVVPGKVVRYRLSDLEQWVRDHTTKKKARPRK